MNCDDPPNLAWTQQDLYTPQPTKATNRPGPKAGYVAHLQI